MLVEGMERPKNIIENGDTPRGRKIIEEVNE